jgi:heat shock protein HtpX
MWEQIRSNQRKSIFLIVFMAVLLVLLGYAVAAAVWGPNAGPVGVIVAVIIWVVLSLTAVAGGDSIMLASAGARRVEKSDLPQLYNVVEEMTISAGLPKPPEVYLIETDVPNAFAVGKPGKAAVAVTTGLLQRLNRDELQGVIAHEIGHISNYDTRFVVLAGVMVGAIVLISDLFLRGLYYSNVGGRGRRSRDGQAIFLVIALVTAIVAPLLAQLLYFAVSRRREYLADASSARFTRFPEGLASALEKIAGNMRGGNEANRVIAPMFTVNPLAAAGGSSLWSTHPPTVDRVKILRTMAGGAAFDRYEEAYEKVTGQSQLIGASALAAEQEPVALRRPAEAPEPSPAERRREAVDVIHRANGYRFAQCECGARIKVPASFASEAIPCPSCGRNVPLPAAA